MNHPIRVCRSKPIGELQANGYDLFFGERTIRESLVKVHTLDEFHDQEVPAILSVKVKNCRDVWVIQLGENMGFITKSPAGMIVGNRAMIEDLDRYLPLEV